MQKLDSTVGGDPAQAKVTGIWKSNLQMKRPSCQSEHYEQRQERKLSRKECLGGGEKGEFLELEKFEYGMDIRRYGAGDIVQ